MHVVLAHRTLKKVGGRFDFGLSCFLVSCRLVSCDTVLTMQSSDVDPEAGMVRASDKLNQCYDGSTGTLPGVRAVRFLPPVSGGLAQVPAPEPRVIQKLHWTSKNYTTWEPHLICVVSKLNTYNFKIEASSTS